MVRDPTPLRFLTLVGRMRVESPPRFDMVEEKGRSGGMIGCETRLRLSQLAEIQYLLLVIHNVGVPIESTTN